MLGRGSPKTATAMKERLPGRIRPAVSFRML